MQLTLKLLVAGVSVALAQVAVVRIHHDMDPERAELPVIGAETLPPRIGDYVGHDEPLDGKMVAASDADVMLNRVYRNQLDDFVVANVGIWTNYEKTIPHRPDGCYPAAGWEVASRRVLKVPVGGSEPLQVQLFVFQRHTARIAVAFWVQLGDETMIESEGIRHIRQRLRSTGGKLPALVKVMLQTEAQNLQKAESRLTRFIAGLRPYTQVIGARKVRVDGHSAGSSVSETASNSNSGAKS